MNVNQIAIFLGAFLVSNGIQGVNPVGLKIEWIITKEKELAYKWNRQVTKREEARQYVTSYLESHPCVDCGEYDYMVLTFDHVRGRKKMDISQMVNQGYSLKAIQKEINKFEVRCANCHMKVEKQRRNR